MRSDRAMAPAAACAAPPVSPSAAGRGAARAALGAAALAAALAASAGPAAAESLPGDPVAGLALARAVCAECHDVEREWQELAAYYGPAFVDIAAEPTVTEMSLRVFFRTPHLEMPNLILTGQQTDDVISYILTLKGAAE